MKPALDVLVRTVRDWVEDDAGLLGAGLAYYGLLSLAPLLLVVVWVAGLYLGEDEAAQQVRSFIGQNFGRDAQVAVASMIRAVRDAEGGFGASMIGAGVMIYASTRLFAQLQAALHLCWGIAADEGDLVHRIAGTLGRRLLSFLLVIAMGLCVIVSVTVQGVVGKMGASFPYTPTLVAWGNDALLSLFLALGLAAIFKWLPCVHVRARDVLPGAFFTAALLVLGKVALGYYFATFAVATAYGIAGATLLVVLWLAYSAQIFLLGAEFTRAWVEVYGQGLRARRGWRRVSRQPLLDQESQR